MSVSSESSEGRQTARKSTANVNINRMTGQVLGVRHRQPILTSGALQKPDPLVMMNERIRKRINQRYERGERRVGRGKDERLVRQAIRKKRRSDESEWRRLRARLHDHDVRCPKTDIPLAPFVRLVKELAVKECQTRPSLGNVRFQHAALLAIRDATEGFMVNMFEQCSLFIAHAGRVTLMNKDIYLARRLWNGTAEPKKKGDNNNGSNNNSNN